MSGEENSAKPSRLIEIDLDESSIGSHTLEVDHERKVAIFDLLEENHFELINGPPAPTGCASESRSSAWLSR